MIKSEDNKAYSENAIVYQISNLARNWQLSNPFFISLRGLLLDEKFSLGKLRLQQEYNFIAKIIEDEVNLDKEEIRLNCERILEYINNYLKEKNQKKGDEILNFLFYVCLLNFYNEGHHFNKLDKDRIKIFLNSYIPSNSNNKNILNVLSFLFQIKTHQNEKYEIIDDLDIVLNMFYSRLLINNKQTRNRDRLLDYYIKQNELENIDLMNISSERTKGKLLEIAVILKVVVGNGIYIPAIEKEQYLSNFTSELLRDKYIKIIKELNKIRIHNWNLPTWSIVLFVGLLESLVFILNNYFDSISFLGLTIKIDFLTKLPTWAIIAINGIAIILYLIFLKSKVDKKINDEKWK